VPLAAAGRADDAVIQRLRDAAKVGDVRCSNGTSNNPRHRVVRTVDTDGVQFDWVVMGL